MIAPERLEEIATGLRAACVRESGAFFLVKEDSLLHKPIAHALSLASDVREVARTFGVDISLRAPDGDAYLSHFATTIGTQVAVPRGWSALDRLLADAHECQHVLQFKQGVDAGWWPRITTHSVLYLAGVVAHSACGEEYIAKVEGDAYAVTQTVRAFLTGHPAPLAECLRPLVDSYNLLGVGAQMAESVLRSHYQTLAAGLVPNVTMAVVAHDWLEAHAADCKGAVRL